MQNRLICITGPTASGKTALSIALAQRLQTEIISSDSMQIYREMDIGTAKPTAAEQAAVPHHMIDIVDPGEPFSVARYVELADQCAQTLLQAGKIPLVVGGTGLYLDALIEGSAFPGDETDHSIREKYERMAREQGNEAVHACLQQVDPVAAERLHPNNLKRVIRALEVFEQTGLTLDAFNQQNKRPEPKYQAIKIGLCPSDREILYARINQRVDQMFEEGLLEEAEHLFREGKLTGTAAQAIGYKELADYFSGNGSLEECVEILKRRTRNYAKRQLTWIKRDPTVFWLTYDAGVDFEQVLQRSTDYLAQQGIQ